MKTRAWIGTHTDGSQHLYLLPVERAPDAESALRWVRNTWCFPVVAMRDQLTHKERAQARDMVAGMVDAMTKAEGQP